MDKVSVLVPFSGFYNTLHDSEFDSELERMFQDENGDDLPWTDDLQMKVFETCQWDKAYLAYAEEYVRCLGAEFDLPFEFEEMKSPREYNFTTDRLFAKLPLEVVQRLRKETSEKEFRDKARQWFTSRDGFMSFYSNDVDTWGPLEEWDHNQLGCLLSAYIDEKAGEEFDGGKQFDLMESARCNGRIDNWISENTPDILRFFKIHDYLVKRMERVTA